MTCSGQRDRPAKLAATGRLQTRGTDRDGGMSLGGEKVGGTQVFVTLLVLGVHRLRSNPDLAGDGAVSRHLPVARDSVEVAVDSYQAPEVLYMELDARGGGGGRP